MIPESFLEHPNDWLADSSEYRLWPGNRADSIHDRIRLRIDEHFKKLFAALRMVRQRSVGEAKPSDIIQAADTVENTATVQGPEPRWRIRTATMVPAATGAGRGSVSTQPMSNCFQAIKAARARSNAAWPCPIVTVASSRFSRTVSTLTIPIGLYDNGKS